MSRRIGILLVLITLVSICLAIYEQVQLRKAKVVVDEDLSGSVPVADATTNDVVEPAPVPAAPDTAGAERIQALQQQVAALQIERNKLQAELAAAQAAQAERVTKEAVRPAPPPVSTNASSRRATFDDRMSQLKQNDPARYAELQKQREEFAKSMQAQADERSDFLKKVDTASMTDAQRANHEKLAQAVEQARAMMAQMATMSPEDAAAARQQMAQTIGSIPDLYQQERRYLLEQTGRAMGYQGAESGQFADYVQQIYDQTAIPRGFGGLGGRGGRGGPSTPVGTTAPAR